MSSVDVDGVIVGEVVSGLVVIRVERPPMSNLSVGVSIAFRETGQTDRFLGTTTAVQDDHHIVVMLDQVSMTEQLTAEDTRHLDLQDRPIVDPGVYG